MFRRLLWTRKRSSVPARRPQPARLKLEILEDRTAPSSVTSDMLIVAAPMNDIALSDLSNDDQGEVEDRHHDDQGVITTTTLFTSIAGATFIDLPASSFLTPVTAQGVTITASNDADGSFFNFTAGTPDAPGSGDGFLDFNNADFSNVSPLTLNFSQPVAAFGVSFMQLAPSIDGGNFSDPAVLKVYDGPNGTGHLLGTVTSSGFVAGVNPLNPNGNQSFVAVLSSKANIESAVLVGTGPNLGFAVDGYALSVTPQGGGGH